MIYSDFVTRISELTAIAQTNADFVAILPAVIDDAEQRCYRDLDLVSTRTRNFSNTLTSGSRNLVITTGTFVVVNGMNVITPFSTNNPELGTRVQLTPMSWDWIDANYGSSSGNSVPKYFAVQDSATFAFAPWPDQNYTVEILGTFRPAPLSVSNTSTVLSLYLPDLFLAAAMMFMSGYMMNFGAQADNPQQAMSWETLYQERLKGAQAEETKKRLLGALRMN